MKSKLHYAEQFHNVLEKETTLRWTVPQCIRKGKIDTTNTNIHDRSLSWHDTDTAIKSGGVELVLFSQLFSTYKENVNPHIKLGEYRCL
jgi:hypothetical protein